MVKRYIDVFNGDADGICALVQLRRANPKGAELVTGIKRDINLLHQVEANSGDHITVLDISFDKNRTDVDRLLQSGASLDYFDHHKTGELIKHSNLYLDIDTSPETCTSLIVDQQLKGRYRAWAITAAFGDNMAVQARMLGVGEGFSQTQLDILQRLGTYLNYNGYGASLDDLFFHPEKLFDYLKDFDDPFSFLKVFPEVFETLEVGYQSDMAKAESLPLLFCNENIAISSFPNEKWARRVGGVFANALTNQHPDRAHAVITLKDNGNYLVSVRAPLHHRFGADALVAQFKTGGGRKAAAGINDLPQDQLELFIDSMKQQFTNVAKQTVQE